jgi:dUTP pyrophosphatase
MTSVLPLFNKPYNAQPVYVLRLCICPADNGVLDEELFNMYKRAASAHNGIVEQHLKNDGPEHIDSDAGFDLFCPEQMLIAGQKTEKVNHKVKAWMKLVRDHIHFEPSGAPCLKVTSAKYSNVGYHMYSRSSTGSKSPLRLANSVGIIDSGYRGNLIAVFDNCQESEFEIEKYQRLVQICPPNLSYPMLIQVVKTDDEFQQGLTARGDKGFGSTGK